MEVDYWAEERGEIRPRRPSPATRLERDPRLVCRIATSLFIHGWVVVFFLGGLMAAWIVAGLLGFH
jgi:hypothetical protein